MQEPLISRELLQKTDKILFLTHLAIGDFTYMQNYFKQLATLYPHLKIDLWVDEYRGKSVLHRWKPGGNYILYDWLKSSCCFNKIYKNASSWRQLTSFFSQTKKENYPIVICLAGIKKHRFAKYARIISPDGFIVGADEPLRKYQFVKKAYFKKLNKTFQLVAPKHEDKLHITDSYAFWFEKIFGFNLQPDSRKPFINIPSSWISYAKLKFVKWEIAKNRNYGQKVVFINTFAKNKKRCWKMDYVAKLIALLRKDDSFYDASFVVNVLPGDYEDFKDSLKNYSRQKIFLFTADHNFFQLPAVISLCDLVVSVETCVIHLAAALQIPVVALMRQKNPEWEPYGCSYKVVQTKKRREWIKDIKVDTVANTTKQFVQTNYSC